MQCKKVQQKFGFLRDSLISKKEAKQIQEHIENCQNCKQEFQKFNDIFNSLTYIKALEPPLNLKTNTLNLIKNTTDKQEFSIIKLFKKYKYVTTIFIFAMISLVYTKLNYQQKIQLTRQSEQNTQNDVGLASLQTNRSISQEQLFLEYEIDVNLKVDENKLQDIIEFLASIGAYSQNEDLSFMLNSQQFQYLINYFQLENVTVINLQEINLKLDQLDKDFNLNTYIKFNIKNN